MIMSKQHKHEWHLTSDYCIHCGMSRVHELDAPVSCHREENVVAISHRRVPKHVIRTSSKSINSSTKLNKP